MRINSIRIRCNTPILHPPIITCHLSLFHLDSHLKKALPTHNNNFKIYCQKPKKKNSIRIKPNLESETRRERVRETEKEEDEQIKKERDWVSTFVAKEKKKKKNSPARVFSHGLPPLLLLSSSSPSSALSRLGLLTSLQICFFFFFFWVLDSKCNVSKLLLGVGEFFFKCESKWKRLRWHVIIGGCKTWILRSVNALWSGVLVLILRFYKSWCDCIWLDCINILYYIWCLLNLLSNLSILTIM